jgi:hypothetical protein
MLCSYLGNFNKVGGFGFLKPEKQPDRTDLRD